MCKPSTLFEFVPFGKGYAISKYNGFNESKVIIPSEYEKKPVVRILCNVFENCVSITEVIMGENITVIEAFAFLNCKNIKNIVMNNILSFIGNGTFKGCENLSYIHLPETLNFIGEYAFGNTSLEKVKLPTKISFISKGLFCGCSKLKQIILSDNIVALGKESFSNCKSLLQIELPLNLKVIGEHAFLNCTNLTEIKVYAIDIDIEENVFCESYVVRPDLRYNPRIYFKPLSQINVQCLPGSSMQLYCRENNIYCSKLEDEIPVDNNLLKNSKMDVVAITFYETNEFIDEIIEKYDLVLEKRNNQNYVYSDCNILYFNDLTTLNNDIFKGIIPLQIKRLIKDIYTIHLAVKKGIKPEDYFC